MRGSKVKRKIEVKKYVDFYIRRVYILITI